MASPIESLIETLKETRAKLEEQLGRNEAYRALRQLEQREASGERLNIVSSDRLRQTIEAELLTDSYFKARRKIDEALEMLGGWASGGNRAALPERTVEAVTAAAEPEPPPVLVTPAVLGNSKPIDIAGDPSDDLSLIRDLPVACVSVVTAAGYGRYQALAAIDSAGVALLERLLGQRGIVARGNWIEQAAILAQGRETRYAARLMALRIGAEWPPEPQAPEIVEAIVPPPPESRAADLASGAPAVTIPVPMSKQPDARLGDPHDLTHISGIDQALAGRLAQAGVTFSRLAGWTAGDTRSHAQSLGIDPARIAAEGWIEQAGLLASGRVSHFLRSKSLRAPLAPLPPPLDVPLDVEPEPLAEAAAAAPAEPAQAPVAEPILVPAAANDDRPPQPEDAQESGPPAAPAIWPAAAAKAAILRPLRKPADRGDKAFDDVAALVAQTVATARNVGGMADRQARPAAPPVAVRAEAKPTAEPPRPATIAAKAAAAPIAKAPSAPAKVAPHSLVAPTGAMNARPAEPRPERSQPQMRAAGSDPEASIEIRARPEAAGTADTADLVRSLGEALAPKSERPPAGRPAATRAKPLVASSRQTASPVTSAPARRMVLIDEINGRAPPLVIEEPKPPEAPLTARASGLFNRLYKALKGERPD